jgi:hypothetical protein
MRRRSILLFSLVGLLGACSGPALPRGDHFGPEGNGIYGVRGMGPGQEIVSMIFRLENHSDETLTIDSIEPFGTKNIGDVAEVVSIALAPLPASGPVVTLSVFDVYPPAELRPGNRCLVQSVEPFSEFPLPPGDGRVGVAVRFRTLVPGKAGIEGLRIVYEAGGERFESFRPAGMQLNVKKKVSRPVAGRLQRVCGDRVEALR